LSSFNITSTKEGRKKSMELRERSRFESDEGSGGRQGKSTAVGGE
jgi:hypothetical protein